MCVMLAKERGKRLFLLEICREILYDRDRKIFDFTEKNGGLERKGIRAEVLREEPFTTAQDHLDFQVYLMVWKRGLFDRTVTVECIGRKAHVKN